MVVNKLIRQLRVGLYGKDVEATKEAVYVYLGDDEALAKFRKQTTVTRRTFGVFFRTHVNRAHKQAGLPQSGVVGSRLEKRMRAANAFSVKGDKLLVEYAMSVHVEPNQGYQSLHRSLWGAYSLGRHWGLSDLGTYNPTSTLPSGGKSDHAVYPAMAFDLGVDPDLGYQHPVGREFFKVMQTLPEVEYVILGDKIAFGSTVRAYTAGQHMNHVHVSGNR